MGDIFNDRSSDYEGSGSVQIATGPIIVTFSGTKGSAGRDPVMSIYSRSGTAGYAPTYSRSAFGRFKVNLADGDEYYYDVTSIESDASIDLSDTPA